MTHTNFYTENGILFVDTLYGTTQIYQVQCVETFMYMK